MSLIRAAIFDLDGTLADTFPLIVSSWNAAMSATLGRTYTPGEVIARFGIPDPAMIAREITNCSQASADPSLQTRAMELYHTHYETQHQLVKSFTEIPEVLSLLQSRKIPLGLVTGKGRRTCQITLQRLGWINLFSAVISGEDMPHQKPAPDGPLLAARTLGIPPHDCAFIGDSPADILAAKNAGMVSIAALWHGHYRDQVISLHPDHLAESPRDLLPLFTR